MGRASAEALAARGVRVHVLGRSAEESGPEGPFAGRHRADLTQPAEAQAAVARVLAAEGRLDALVHAVGDYSSQKLADLGPAELQRLFTSNVLTAVTAIDAARAALRASRGRVVVFGSAGLDGLGARRRAAGYAAAKSALVVLARSLAAEEAPHGISVNLVSPGLSPHPDAHPETLDPEAWARLPRGRPTPAGDIAALVTWLILDAPEDLTGADLPVAGGWLL